MFDGGVKYAKQIGLSTKKKFLLTPNNRKIRFEGFNLSSSTSTSGDSTDSKSTDSKDSKEEKQGPQNDNPNHQK